MEASISTSKNSIVAALLGAFGGGIIVAVATRAIPKMMGAMMRDMMSSMMEQMGEAGCDPAEM